MLGLNWIERNITRDIGETGNTYKWMYLSFLIFGLNYTWMYIEHIKTPVDGYMCHTHEV